MREKFILELFGERTKYPWQMVSNEGLDYTMLKDVYLPRI